MLWCSFCVHPSEVCDGIFQCPNGDDENLMFCGRKECPPDCSCLGLAVVCHGADMTFLPDISTHVQFISYTGNKWNITKFTFKGMTKLKTSDITNMLLLLFVIRLLIFTLLYGYHQFSK